MKSLFNNLIVSLRQICLVLYLFMFCGNASGQAKDSSAKVLYPNIPKISISSYTLYQKSIHIGYERVLDRNHSIYVFGGYNEFPNLTNLELTGATLSNSKTKSGYTFGAEFRFYLPKENKDPAPHGVFLAPYVSYYGFRSTRTLTHTDSAVSQSANLTLKTGLFNVGVELGYQFVIGKHFVIDCELLGPSFTYYSFEASLDGQINGASEDLQKILDAVKAKFPLLNDLSSGKTVSSSGSATSKFPFIGFRYAISIGYAF